MSNEKQKFLLEMYNHIEGFIYGDMSRYIISDDEIIKSEELWGDFMYELNQRYEKEDMNGMLLVFFKAVMSVVKDEMRLFTDMVIDMNVNGIHKYIDKKVGHKKLKYRILRNGKWEEHTVDDKEVVDLKKEIKRLKKELKNVK